MRLLKHDLTNQSISDRGLHPNPATFRVINNFMNIIIFSDSCASDLALEILR